MKHNYMILTVLIVASACFLRIGCEGQAVASGGAKPELTASEPATGSAKAETTPKADKGGPEITFEKVVHDFGDIGPGTKIASEFKFTNTGDGLLKIQKVQTCCGFRYKLRDNKREYAPGESGAVIITHNAGRSTGQVAKHQYVFSNDETRPKVILTVKGRIVQKVDYQPKRLNLLLNKENAGCPAITIRSLDGKAFSIKRFKTTGRSKSTKKAITADFDSSVEATEFVLQPKVDIEKLRKGLNGHIEITLTHPESGVVAIPFNVLPRFKIDPPSLIVKAEAEKPVTRGVWILSNYDEDFEVESTSTQKGAIKVLSQERKDNRYKFELEITPPATKESQKRFFTDVFFVNIKGGERLEVTCRLFYLRK